MQRKALFYLVVLFTNQKTVLSLDSNETESVPDIGEHPVVKTLNGPVKGVRTNFLNLTVDEFLGIPYAKPPLGNLRFKKPVPSEPWTGVFDARTLPNTCQQLKQQAKTTSLSEDCLYLNLWVPKGAQNASVLIWIHGGGYFSGSSTMDLYNGKMLAATTGVIVASMNYRVGVFGFLYMGNEDVPGNMGLYDQVLAIKWIKDNIQFFGGNPNSVTLFGQSAGAGSVSFLLMSPVSSNLTRRGILESGSGNAPWSYVTPDIAKTITLNLINNVGCNNASLTTSNFSSAVECLKSKDAETLTMAQFLNPPSAETLSALPTADGTFIPKDPNAMLDEGNFPPAEIIVGTTSEDGAKSFYATFYKELDLNKPPNLTRQAFLKMVDEVSKTRSKVEREAIAYQYTEWNPAVLNDENGSFLNTMKIIDSFTDYAFKCPVDYMAQKFADHGGSVYNYYFTQRSRTSPWGRMWNMSVHGDEVGYVFGHPLDPRNNFTLAEQNLSSRIMNYFTTFAKTGKPETDGPMAWPKYSSMEPVKLVLNSEIHGVVQGDRHQYCALWNTFLPQVKKTCSAGTI